MKEIEHCIKQGFREIKFIDDTLAADYDRAMKLAEEIKRSGLDFHGLHLPALIRWISLCLRHSRKQGAGQYSLAQKAVFRKS